MSPRTTNEFTQLIVFVFDPLYFPTCTQQIKYYFYNLKCLFFVQTGAWGCFDEFNRINVEVLSVVAQQILSILSALYARTPRFTFERREITLIATCGIFITMNPG